MKFELMVAVRYLRAKRKQAVISLITIISVIGVAAGVAALIIALAINAGFTEDLQEKLLGAQAHITVVRRDEVGIADYLNLTKEIEKFDGVVAAAPSLYQQVMVSNTRLSRPAIIKGILPETESRMSNLEKNIISGSIQDFGEGTIVIGQVFAAAIGATVGDMLEVLSAQTTLTPMGAMPIRKPFRVIAVFSSGLYDLDSTWVYVPINDSQRLRRSGDVAGSIEIKVKDIYQARAIGQQIVDKLGNSLEFDDWMALNRPIFEALRLEKLVTYITIGLIVIVAALNIVATLIMMVLEKTRDIAILMSMGATRENIRRVFILQGVIIGVIGTAIGVVLGNSISYLADKYRLVSLAPEVYTIAYVPFRLEIMDTVVVAATAVLISFLATLYPSAAASRLHPVEALRYE